MIFYRWPKTDKAFFLCCLCLRWSYYSDLTHYTPQVPEREDALREAHLVAHSVSLQGCQDTEDVAGEVAGRAHGQVPGHRLVWHKSRTSRSATFLLSLCCTKHQLWDPLNIFQKLCVSPHLIYLEKLAVFNKKNIVYIKKMEK